MTNKNKHEDAMNVLPPSPTTTTTTTPLRGGSSSPSLPPPPESFPATKRDSLLLGAGRRLPPAAAAASRVGGGLQPQPPKRRVPFQLADVTRLRPLGTGTFSSVYQVSIRNDDDDDEEEEEEEVYFALKCLESSTSFGLSEEVIQTAIQEMENEIKILSHLKQQQQQEQHPNTNIIQLHGITTLSSVDINNDILCLHHPGGMLLDLLHDETLETRLCRWREQSPNKKSSSSNSNSRSSRSSGGTMVKKAAAPRGTNPTTDSVVDDKDDHPLVSTTTVPNLTQRLERIALEIVKGLEFLHSKQILLRNLQPSNIGFDATTGRIKIFDLGLARNLHPPKKKKNSNNVNNMFPRCRRRRPPPPLSNRRVRRTGRKGTSGGDNDDPSEEEEEEPPPPPPKQEDIIAAEIQRAGKLRYQAPELVLLATTATTTKTQTKPKTSHSATTTSTTATTTPSTGSTPPQPPQPPPIISNNVSLTLSSDIYSLGMILWEICSLRHMAPIHFTTLIQYRQQMMIHQVRPSLASIPSQLLRTLIGKCWHSDPTVRPTITQVKRLLELKLYTQKGWNWSSRVQWVRVCGPPPMTTMIKNNNNNNNNNNQNNNKIKNNTKKPSRKNIQSMTKTINNNKNSKTKNDNNPNTNNNNNNNIETSSNLDAKGSSSTTSSDDDNHSEKEEEDDSDVDEKSESQEESRASLLYSVAAMTADPGDDVTEGYKYSNKLF
jgi:serine/threonine protein kinase